MLKHMTFKWKQAQLTALTWHSGLTKCNHCKIMHMNAHDVKLQMKLRYEFNNNNNNISSGDVGKRLPRPAGQTRALCCFISSKGDAMSLITSSSACLKEPISRVSLDGWHGASKRPFGCDQFWFFHCYGAWHHCAVHQRALSSRSRPSVPPWQRGTMATTSGP